MPLELPFVPLMYEFAARTWWIDRPMPPACFEIWAHCETRRRKNRKRQKQEEQKKWGGKVDKKGGTKKQLDSGFPSTCEWQDWNERYTCQVAGGTEIR